MPEPYVRRGNCRHCGDSSAVQNGWIRYAASAREQPMCRRCWRMMMRGGNLLTPQGAGRRIAAWERAVGQHAAQQNATPSYPWETPPWSTDTRWCRHGIEPQDCATCTERARIRAAEREQRRLRREAARVREEQRRARELAERAREMEAGNIAVNSANTILNGEWQYVIQPNTQWTISRVEEDLEPVQPAREWTMLDEIESDEEPDEVAF